MPVAEQSRFGVWPATPPPAPVRPLIPALLALMAGLLAAAWGLPLPRAWTLPLLAGLWLGLLAGWWTDRRLLLLPLAFFFALGVAMYGQARDPVLPPGHLVEVPTDREVSLLGRLARPAKVGPERLQLCVAVEAWRGPRGWQPATGLLAVSAPKQEPPPVGSRLVVRGKLKAPRRLNNPGAFDRPRHLAADGMFRTLTVQRPEDLVWLATGGYPLRERLRGGIRQLLKPLPPELRAMYLALLLGDQGEVTPAMRQAFSRTGTSHLVVISGLHLGAVAAVTYFLSFWLMRCFPWLLLRLNAVKVATFMAAGPVVGYAWMAGGSPATQRAEIMVLAYLLLLLLGRPREVWSALALAALVILTLNPLRLFSASFALSFAAVAGILYLVPRWGLTWEAAVPAGPPGAAGPAHRLRGLRRRGWEVLAVSLAASLATAPLAASFFNVVSLLGILVNVVAIPLVLMLALPLGEVAVLAQALKLQAVAQGFIWLGQWPLGLGWQAIALAARLPGAAFFCPTPTWLQVGLYAALVVLLFCRPRRRLTLLGAGLAAGTLALTVVLPWWSRPGVGEVTVLDSPTGLSALVVAPDGRRLAVSAGWPAYPGREEGRAGILPRYLHARQFRRLEAVAGLTLTPSNGPDLLEVAQQFRVDHWTLARGGELGEAAVTLINLLGDGQEPVPEPGRGHPGWQWGEVGLKLVPLRGGVGLEVDCFGRRVVLLPPVAPRATEGDHLQGEGRLEAVVSARPPSSEWLVRHRPRRLILYGGGESEAPVKSQVLEVLRTPAGAVTLTLAPEGVRVSQWTSP